MIEIFKSEQNVLTRIPEPEPGCWIHITQPGYEELMAIGRAHQIEETFLLAALDEEESARVEKENDQTLIIVDIPLVTPSASLGDAIYSTIPLVIIILDQMLITICLESDTFLNDFIQQPIKGFQTQFRSRFVLQILFRNSTRYLSCLRQIERAANRLEEHLIRAQKNKEILEMLRLEKSLVFLLTSLRANGVVLERMMRNPYIKNYPEDEDLLEDVIIENKQAIEMATIYSTILAASTESFASIISNNQNNVMKILTSATIVMTIPTLISGLMGMNVRLPVSQQYGFWQIVAATLILVLVTTILLWRKHMF